MIPGLVATSVAVVTGLFLAKLMFLALVDGPS
jgi:hypothetical protein